MWCGYVPSEVFNPKLAKVSRTGHIAKTKKWMTFYIKL